MRFPVGAVLGCLVALVLAGCGEAPPSSADAIQNYQAALAEGNYGKACSYLDTGARTALSRRLGHPASCAEAMARCLPYNATNLKQDQSQLLFANVVVSQRGDHSSVSLSGTAVADAIRQVSLAKKRTGWTLTSYGQGFTACHRRRGTRRRRS